MSQKQKRPSGRALSERMKEPLLPDFDLAAMVGADAAKLPADDKKLGTPRGLVEARGAEPIAAAA